MLIEHLKDHYQSLSIVGMAKNAGKTVTLNALLDEAFENNLKIALTSIGRDGEKKDIVTATHKPMIHVYEGMWVATAESLFAQSEAKLEILEITDYITSMGNVIIGKVIMGGTIEIAGPCSNEQMMQLIKKMKNYGADLVVVDGAVDRKSTASPSVTEATILSTGAVLSRDMNKAIEKTLYQGMLFQLKSADLDFIRTIADQAIESQRIAIVGETTIYLEAKTALNAGHLIGGALNEKTTHVILPGALVKKTLMDMVQSSKEYKHVTLIVKDATRIFIDYKDWLYFEKIGVKILVRDGINLMAVTTNPTSPSGYYFDRKIYRERLQFYFKDIPVIDVMG